jgi:hypothetical protein
MTDYRNRRLSMQTNELEMLSQRIKEAEEHLRQIEEENEDTSSGRPTPPVSPMHAVPTTYVPSESRLKHEEDEDRIHEDRRKETLHE